VNMLRRINLSATIIVLICFFLPWVQVSCAGARDTLTGLDLARNGHSALWFIPVLMGALILLAVIRAWREDPKIYSITSAICGGIVTYLMNKERLRVHDESGLISAQLTGWFWLGLFASLSVVVSGLLGLWRRKQPS
jgi:hypothetical protein